MMDNKAQVSFEYLVIISLLVMLSTMIMMLSQNYVNISDALTETGNTYKDKLLQMM